jgi:hypothetical protein
MRFRVIVGSTRCFKMPLVASRFVLCTTRGFRYVLGILGLSCFNGFIIPMLPVFGTGARECTLGRKGKRVREITGELLWLSCTALDFQRYRERQKERERESEREREREKAIGACVAVLRLSASDR